MWTCENKFKQLTKVKEHFKNTHQESKQSSFYGVKHIKQSKQRSLWPEISHHILDIPLNLNLMNIGTHGCWGKRGIYAYQ